MTPPNVELWWETVSSWKPGILVTTAYYLLKGTGKDGWWVPVKGGCSFWKHNSWWHAPHDKLDLKKPSEEKTLLHERNEVKAWFPHFVDSAEPDLLIRTKFEWHRHWCADEHFHFYSHGANVKSLHRRIWKTENCCHFFLLSTLKHTILSTEGPGSRRGHKSDL